MVKYICYNWMPVIAQHAMDENAEFYRAAGAGTLHNHPIFDPYKVKDNDLIFVKTDFIINGAFENYALVEFLHIILVEMVMILIREFYHIQI